jgi:hypothetical protein
MLFHRYIGIDYSGAETPISPLKGLRVYLATRGEEPREIPPPAGMRKFWTRRGIAEWLVAQAHEDGPSLIGIDHGFSFPLAYFRAHGLPLDWAGFLDDFQAHWPTDEDIYVDFVREGVDGAGALRSGDPHWRRIAEVRARAKSVFHFDVPGSVAKSTHAGLPWLRYIRNHAAGRVHFWPFEGWTIPGGLSVIAEVYPKLVSGSFPRENRSADQHDAYAVAAWLRHIDASGALHTFLEPTLTLPDRRTAEIEGWILGVATIM